MNIALIKTGALGDVVRTTSLVPALRRKYPDGDVTWITSDGALPLVAGLADVHAVTIDDAVDAPWRAARYDWIISLDDDRVCCELATELQCARLSGAYVNRRGDNAYTNDLARWFGMGLLRPASLGGLAAANELKRANLLTYGELLYAGLDLPLPVAPPSVAIPASARRRSAAWLAARGLAAHSIVGVSTGAADRWRFKSWSVAGTSSLARRLADAGWTVAVLGGRAEAERNGAICARAAHARVVDGPHDFDLLSFAALVARCSLLVCSDSLAMHLAIATGVRVAALFGPTSDAEIDLFGPGVKIAAPVPCVRCYLPTCDVTPNCMQAITPEMVFARLPLTTGRAAPAVPLSATARR